MNLMFVQKLHRIYIQMIDDFRFSGIKSFQFFHVSFIQLKIPDTHIFKHPIWVNSFGDDDNIPLNGKSESDLCHCFVVLIRDALQRHIVPYVMASFSQWSPCHDSNAKFIHDLNIILTLIKWVALNLIYGGSCFKIRAKISQAIRIEIGNTDRFYDTTMEILL